MSVPASSTPKWVPIESNPDVFTAYAQSLSFPTEAYRFYDIFGLDPDLLSMVPQPVKAVLLLFPTGKEQDGKSERLEAEGKVWPAGKEESERPGGVLWIPQTIGNACGTMGLLHGLANAGVDLPRDSPLGAFFALSRTLPPTERTALLASSTLLERAHSVASGTGQTILREEDNDTNLHFTCFVQARAQDGRAHLIELDGRRKGPIDHGVSTDLLTDSAKLVETFFMSTYPDSNTYSLMALGPASDDF
ncbi:Ubiquitin C-terminal hydrolase UCHL1 [Phaffia rhodozyma]|uniref:Ubiquitin carboxyl-terminal hydrolase n=1 Tax=Phaffia rhodozyma TaxID=264483 RepID=A0A0F7SJM2_PHARH|nr:Ubiquitin C-terminal hydrolase UCHL1 [Phaffia rhodozyma]